MVTHPGMRVLDGIVTDLLEAQALLYGNQHIDIYSASWGPRDDGKRLEGPHPHTALAYAEGVKQVCLRWRLGFESSA